MDKSALTKTQTKELTALVRGNGGALTKEQLLGAIEERGEDSPLYSIVFDCDDDVASRRYRLERCRWILRHARFEYKATGNPEPLQTRRVMSVERPSGEVFLLTEKAASTKKYRDQMQDNCRSDLARWRQKWTAILGGGFVNEVLRGET